MKKAYIFTNGKSKMEDGFRWYIDYFSSLEEAEKSCKEGWVCDLYTTTKQWL